MKVLGKKVSDHVALELQREPSRMTSGCTSRAALTTSAILSARSRKTLDARLD
jgi:hypothetical protein